MTKYSALIALSILLLNISSSMVAESATYPVIVNKYRALVVYKGFKTRTSLGETVLNGELSGVLSVKYVFRFDKIYVSTKYLEYTLKGFKEPRARRVIVAAVKQSRSYVFYSEEKPYPSNEVFVLKPRIMYYVSPSNLEPDGRVEQKTVVQVASAKSFPLNTSTRIEYREERFFRYDVSTGVLIELNITSKVLSGTNTSLYMISLSLVDSSIKQLDIYTVDNALLASSTILVIVIGGAVTWRCTRFRKSQYSS